MHHSFMPTCIIFYLGTIGFFSMDLQILQKQLDESFKVFSEYVLSVCDTDGKIFYGYDGRDGLKVYNPIGKIIAGYFDYLIK